MYEWKKQDIGRPHLIGIAIIIVLLLFCWLYYDHNRNKPIHNDTDGTVESIEKRVDAVESGVGQLSNRIAKTQKTIGKTYVTITESRGNAETIGNGIGRIENNLDQAIQRSGRIANLINDIERANR